MRHLWKQFQPSLLKIVEKDALLSLWLSYWLYRQARQVSSSTLLVKVEKRVDQQQQKGRRENVA